MNEEPSPFTPYPEMEEFGIGIPFFEPMEIRFLFHNSTLKLEISNVFGINFMYILYVGNTIVLNQLLLSLFNFSLILSNCL